MLFEVCLTQSGLGKTVELLTEGALSAIFVAGVVGNTTLVTVYKKKKKKNSQPGLCAATQTQLHTRIYEKN